MEMTSDLHRSGRNVTGDRLYSYVDTAEQLFKRNLTYCGAVMANRKGLPTKIKSVKERELNSSVFMWKKDSPVMVVSYCPKKKKNVLLITTSHEDPDICEEPHKKQKPAVIDFYNSQRCGVDIVNEMIKDYSSQPVCYSWTISVFTLILDLAAVNANTILGYNSDEKKKQSRISKKPGNSTYSQSYEVKITCNFFTKER